MRLPTPDVATLLLVLQFTSRLVGSNSQRIRRYRSLFRNGTVEVDDETRALLLVLQSSVSAGASGGDNVTTTFGRKVNENPKLRGLSETESKVLDAIVIGAGWAGLGAATVLRSKGKKIAVLEARNVVGGRSRSTKLGSTRVELGSQWIHGATEENPIYRLVEQYQAPHATSGIFSDGVWSDEYQSTRPHRVPDAELTRMFDRIFEDGWFPYQRERQHGTNVDSSLRATTDSFIQSQQFGANDERALEFLLSAYIVHEYAASLEDLSTWWWNQDSSISGDDIMLKRGYGDLAQSYAGSLRDNVHLSARVTEVNWRNDTVSVTYVQEGVSRTLRARNVVVTVPLGVLKAKAIAFQPALPTWKVNSIDRLGVGLLNKVIMKWDASTSLPWPKNMEWLEKIGTPQAQWSQFLSYQPTSGHNILISFCAGREARRVEQLSNNEVLAEMLVSLKQMFGTTIPSPTAYRITRWNQDPYARGSYSYYKVNSQPQDRINLCAALGDRVYFAGEACHLKYPSTTHGALLSGLAIGNKIASG